MSSQDGPTLDKKSSVRMNDSLEELSTGTASSKEANSLEQSSLPESMSVREYDKAPEALEPDAVLQRLQNLPRLETLSTDPSQQQAQSTEHKHQQGAGSQKSKQQRTSNKPTIDLSGETILDKLINFVASLIKILERFILGALRRFAPDSDRIAPVRKNQRATVKSEPASKGQEDIGEQEYSAIPSEKRGAQREGRGKKMQHLDTNQTQRDVSEESGFPGPFDDD